MEPQLASSPSAKVNLLALWSQFNSKPKEEQAALVRQAALRNSAPEESFAISSSVLEPNTVAISLNSTPPNTSSVIPVRQLPQDHHELIEKLLRSSENGIPSTAAFTFIYEWIHVVANSGIVQSAYTLDFIPTLFALWDACPPSLRMKELRRFRTTVIEADPAVGLYAKRNKWLETVLHELISHNARVKRLQEISAAGVIDFKNDTSDLSDGLSAPSVAVTPYEVAEEYNVLLEIVALIETIAKFSVGIRELKAIFRALRIEREETSTDHLLYWAPLVDSLQRILQREDPRAYIRFAPPPAIWRHTIASAAPSIRIPSPLRWPAAGWGFAAWLYIEPPGLTNAFNLFGNSSNALVDAGFPSEMHIFSLQSTAGEERVEILLNNVHSNTSAATENPLSPGVTVRYNIKHSSSSASDTSANAPLHTADNEFGFGTAVHLKCEQMPLRRWTFVCISHHYQWMKTSEVRLYIDGELCTTASLSYPKIDEPLCAQLGGVSVANADTCWPFQGKIGTVYFFHETPSVAEISGLFRAGDDPPPRWASDAAAAKSTSTKLLFCYSPQAAVRAPQLSHSVDVDTLPIAFLDELSSLDPKRRASVSRGLWRVATPTRYDLVAAAGGVRPFVYAMRFAENTAGIVSVLRLLTTLLLWQPNAAILDDMATSQGFALLGQLFGELPPAAIGPAVPAAVDDLRRALRTRFHGNSAHAGLATALTRNVLLNFSMWTRTCAETQRAHMAVLVAMTTRSNGVATVDSEDAMAAFGGVAGIVEALFRYYAKPSVDIVDTNESHCLFREMRAGLLEILRACGRVGIQGNGTAWGRDDIGRLLSYVAACVSTSTDDTVDFSDVLQLLGELLRNNSAAKQHLVAMGALEVFVQCLASVHFAVRCWAFECIIRIDPAVVLTKSHLCQIKRHLAPYAVDMSTYVVLRRFLLGQSAENPLESIDSECVANSENSSHAIRRAQLWRIRQPAALWLLYELTSSGGVRAGDGVLYAALSDWLLLAHASADNRNALLASDWLTWAIGLLVGDLSPGAAPLRRLAANLLASAVHLSLYRKGGIRDVRRMSVLLGNAPSAAAPCIADIWRQLAQSLRRDAKCVQTLRGVDIAGIRAGVLVDNVRQLLEGLEGYLFFSQVAATPSAAAAAVPRRADWAVAAALVEWAEAVGNPGKFPGMPTEFVAVFERVEWRCLLWLVADVLPAAGVVSPSTERSRKSAQPTGFAFLGDFVEAIDGGANAPNVNGPIGEWLDRRVCRETAAPPAKSGNSDVDTALSEALRKLHVATAADTAAMPLMSARECGELEALCVRRMADLLSRWGKSDLKTRRLFCAMAALYGKPGKIQESLYRSILKECRREQLFSVDEWNHADDVRLVDAINTAFSFLGHASAGADAASAGVRELEGVVAAMQAEAREDYQIWQNLRTCEDDVKTRMVSEKEISREAEHEFHLIFEDTWTSKLQPEWRLRDYAVATTGTGLLQRVVREMECANGMFESPHWQRLPWQLADVETPDLRLRLRLKRKFKPQVPSVSKETAVPATVSIETDTVTFRSAAEWLRMPGDVDGVFEVLPKSPSGGCVVFRENEHSLKKRRWRWCLGGLRAIYVRRSARGGDQSAVELFFGSAGVALETAAMATLTMTTLLFAFPDKETAAAAIRGVVSTLPTAVPVIDAATAAKRLVPLTERWRNREISTFEYIVGLNTLSGRNWHDPTQYFVFPWLLGDEPGFIRDFSNGPAAPLGSPLYFLIRIEPFTTRCAAERAQSTGEFAEFLQSMVSPNGQRYELVPEFFYLPEFLENINHLPFLGGVALPAWAHGSSVEYVRKHREVLECELVSGNIHEWFDAVWGVRAHGTAAAGDVTVPPTVLFTAPHPRRRTFAEIAGTPSSGGSRALSLLPLSFSGSNMPSTAPKLPANGYTVHLRPGSTHGLCAVDMADSAEGRLALVFADGVFAANNKLTATSGGSTANPLKFDVDKALRAAGKSGTQRTLRHFDSEGAALGVAMVMWRDVLVYIAGDHRRHVVMAANLATGHVLEFEAARGSGTAKEGCGLAPMIEITCVAIDDDAAAVAMATGCADGSVVIWDNAPAQLGSVAAEPAPRATIANPFSSLAAMVAGRRHSNLYAALKDLRPRRVLVGHTTAVAAVAVSIETGLVISADSEGIVLVRDIATGAFVASTSLKGRPERLIISPREAVAIVQLRTVGAQTVLSVLTLGTARTLAVAELPLGAGAVTVMLVTADGEFVIIGDTAGIVSVRRTSDLSPVRQFSVDNGTATGSLTTNQSCGTTGVRSLCLAFQEQCVVAGLSDGRLWVIPTKLK